MAPSPETEQQQQQPSSNTNDKANLNQNHLEHTLKDTDPDDIAKHFFDDDPEMQIEPNMRPNDVSTQEQNHTNDADVSKNPSSPQQQTSLEKNTASNDHVSTANNNQNSNEKQKDTQDKTTDKETENANDDTDEIMSDPKTSQPSANKDNEQQPHSTTTPNNDSASKPQPQNSEPTNPAQEPPQRPKRQIKQHIPSLPAPESHLFQKVLTDPATGPALMASCLEDVVRNGPGMLSVTLSLVTSAGRPVAYAKENDLVTPSMILSNDPKAAVDKIDEIVRKDEGGRIALMARDTIAKRVRRSYEDMWKKAITNANAEVLRTTDFYETICTWLESMVLSRSRAIRIAACLAAFRLTDGLLESRMRVRKQLASVQRQLQTEKRKCAKSNVSKRSRSRVDNSQLSAKGQELSKKVTELTEESEILYELAEELFSTIFIIKYRDVSPEIRATAISALGGWIIYNPEHFLDEIHSKYIGWLLSDRESVVRKAAIHAIARALKEEQLHEHLGTFLDRFSDRIVEMSRDKDDHVAVAAIDVLTSIIPYDILTDDASEKICEMAVNERHKDIRRAAGRFLARLSKIRGSEALPNTSTATRGPQKRARGKTAKVTESDNGSCDLPPEQALADLRVFITSISGKGDGINGCRRVVNAVWESFPALTCWDSIIDLLLDKDSQRQQTQSRSGRRVSSRRSSDSSSRSQNPNPLSADDKTLLCGVLLSSIQELQVDELSATAKTAKKKDADNFRSMRTAMTKRLLNRLPEVLRRFQFDSLSLEALVQIPAYFDLEGMDGEETESHFNLMLNRLLDVMNRNIASQNIAEDCARTLKVLLSDKNPMKQQTVSCLQTAFGTISKELSLYVSSDLSNAEPHSLASNVFRARLLTEMIEPNKSIQTCIKSILEYQLKNESTGKHEEEITKNALRTACAILVWSLSKISSSLKENDADVAIGGVLETDEAKERLALMTEMQLLLRQTCEKEELSLSTRVTSVQMLLTALTLSRGIEKFATSQAMKTRENDGTQDKSIPNFTLLMDETEKERTTKAVISCFHTLLRDGIDSKNSASNDQNQESPELSNQTLTSCFASLVQASFQSSISSQISHLPLLGLLLKPTEVEENDAVSSFSVSALCREYAVKRRLGLTMTKAEIAAFHEIISIADSTKQRRTLLRKLAEILFSLGGKVDIAKHARSSISKLCDHAINSQSEKKALEDSLEVLCSSSYVYLPHLGHEDFTVISKQLQVIWNAGRQQSIINTDSSECSFYDNFHDCVTELARDENAEASKVVKMFDGTKPKMVVSATRRKRHQADPAFHLSSSSPGSGEVRRSKRARTVIDYASIEESDSGEDQNEDREEADEADEEVDEDSNMLDSDHELADDTELQTPEEMAREMVQFRNSPGPSRARKSNRGREVAQQPPVRSSPRKSRPSSSASTPRAVSGKKPPKAPSKLPRTPRTSGAKTRQGTQSYSPNESRMKKLQAAPSAASEEKTTEEENPSQANGHHEESNQSTATDSPASRLRSRRSTRGRPDGDSSSRVSSEEHPSSKSVTKNVGSKDMSGGAPSTEPTRPVIRRKRRRW